ncbi:hypothetical protein [Falsiroseomonas ponticola]|jgi:hypothetical protein|uniref:hypothetical protein n=1 Tax=Falsiroseomonas ponticola TaxID=2786951 RepID=UPI001932E80D|nr:hypothetical protein [Roseomonas ponticola]
MSRFRTPILGLALLAGACTGTQTDPFAREGNWRPNGANEANLVRMLATPTDYTQGQAAPDAMGELATSAVQRLLQDRVRNLPTSATTQGMAGASGIGGAQ